MLVTLTQALQNSLGALAAEPTLALWLMAFVVVWFFVLRVAQSLKGQKLSSMNLKVSEHFELAMSFENSDSKSTTDSKDK